MSSELDVRRVNFSPEADARLKRLKGRTGVTPNLLCRVGFCLSLEEQGVPSPLHYPSGPRDINRYTLTGPFDSLFVALLRQRLHEDGLTWEDSAVQFHAHMNRGVLLLGTRATDLPELMGVCSSTRAGQAGPESN